MIITTLVAPTRPAGELLREWRLRRRLSQRDLACEADISTSHLSFLETGRALPSRDMVLKLAERLDLPLRDRNVLLDAAGFAPAFPERRLGDPALEAVWRGIDAILTGQEPNPAWVIDRHWHMVASNRAVAALIVGVEPMLLRPPVNVLRLSLHPAGLASRIPNLRDWRGHIAQRLRRQIELSGDQVLIDLLEEIADYPEPPAVGATGRQPVDYGGVAVPFQLETINGTLSFYSTTTVLDAAVDITVSELAIEAFFPANTQTAEAMRKACCRTP